MAWTLILTYLFRSDHILHKLYWDTHNTAFVCVFMYRLLKWPLEPRHHMLPLANLVLKYASNTWAFYVCNPCPDLHLSPKFVTKVCRMKSNPPILPPSISLKPLMTLLRMSWHYVEARKSEKAMRVLHLNSSRQSTHLGVKKQIEL